MKTSIQIVLAVFEQRSSPLKKVTQKGCIPYFDTQMPVITNAIRNYDYQQ
ncbi:hypothetical protein [Candidatus Enterovibrio escicola]|nr:hypothetical protein [Candidatus Enterovibrio escacola]